jgi:NAD-dependent deacetylase
MNHKETKIVVFSGAGMSAESGIQTFRDSDGLWEEHKIEDVATPEAWRRDPDLVTSFYNERRKKVMESKPNAAHLEINKLQEVANVHVVTQNIDDLHERAGNKNVLHLHGNIRYAKSSGPKQETTYYKIEGWEIKKVDLCPDGFRLRPHVVWFGESVPAYEEAAEIIGQADVLIVIGTSLQVHPAAGLVQTAYRAQHKYIIDPKAELLSVPSDFKKVNAKAGDGIKQILDELKNLLLDN